MPQATVEGLILGTIPTGEQDKIVHLLARESGLMRGIAPGALKTGNRFGSLLEPFTLGSFQYHWNQERELITLTRGDLLRTFFPLISRTDAVFVFGLIAEVVLRFVPHGQPSPRHFRLLLALLDAGEKGGSLPHLLLYFLTWALRLEGCLFNTTRCTSCGAPITESAWLMETCSGIVCPRCRRGEKVPLSVRELTFLEWTLRHPPTAVEPWRELIPPPSLARALIRCVEHHGELSLKTASCLPLLR